MESLWALVSGCTKEPYVVCDPETFDDEIMMFFSAQDAEGKAKQLNEAGIPVGIVKLEKRQMLLFYTSLYTMGINALLVSEGDTQTRIQLADFVRRNKPEQDPEGKLLVENPSLHLTALYYMQETRKPSVQEGNPQIKEWQDEISNYFSKGSFIAAVQKEGNGIPVVKLNDKEVYQAIFTDIMEFQKFNKENQLRPIVVTADKIPQILVAEATGLRIQRFLSGTHGGDQQIAARIACNEIDLLLFFRDPISAKPHEPNEMNLLRLCDVHNIPIATNIATAEVLIHGLERGDLDWRNIVNPNR